jgi:ferredoxin
MCEVEAPNNFHVPHRGKVELITPILPEDDRTAVEQAVWACPTRALTIKEDH